MNLRLKPGDEIEVVKKVRVRGRVVDIHGGLVLIGEIKPPEQITLTRTWIIERLKRGNEVRLRNGDEALIVEDVDVRRETAQKPSFRTLGDFIRKVRS